MSAITWEEGRAGEIMRILRRLLLPRGYCVMQILPRHVTLPFDDERDDDDDDEEEEEDDDVTAPGAGR